MKINKYYQTDMMTKAELAFSALDRDNKDNLFSNFFIEMYLHIKKELGEIMSESTESVIR